MYLPSELTLVEQNNRGTLWSDTIVKNIVTPLCGVTVANGTPWDNFCYHPWLATMMIPKTVILLTAKVSAV